MKIAILGATSQIARDLVLSFSLAADDSLYLFARRPDEVFRWLVSRGLNGCYPVEDFSRFDKHEFDAIINFVGVGNPAHAVEIGASIFEITQSFDEMVLKYLKKHSACRYLFLSSGAAYGNNFIEPASQDKSAIITINDVGPHEWYGVAKLYAEYRHRAHAELPIIDIRVFNYISRTLDLSARFLITDILRAMRNKTVLKTSSDNIVRDFLHPSDFYGLVRALLNAPKINTVVDCYSRAPIDKLSLLTALNQEFGLHYEVVNATTGVNATGSKPLYYSLNRRAADFGYEPSLTSLNSVLMEAAAILNEHEPKKYYAK